MKRFTSMSIMIILWYFAGCTSTCREPVSSQMSPGHKTISVNLDNYSEIKYVSNTKGSDSEGSGSQISPWASISFALSQIRDADAENRYAILVSAADYANTPITMKEYVDLYGGFSEVDWKRDVQKNRTVITGGTDRRVIIGADSARLDGFVIANGRIRGKGAGM